MPLDYSSLYRLPVSKNDNFNGWIEITTLCNIRCPGCYRRCDQDEHQGRHKTLAEIREEILELERIRNCSMVSISGGEALLHPDLDAVVSFVRERGMTPVLFTNGLLLTDERLAALRRAGLVAMVVRLDTLQAENRGKTESDLHPRRERLAALADRHDVFLALTSCLDRSNLDQVPEVLDWGRRHADRVGQHLLILRRGLVVEPTDPVHPEGMVFLPDLVDVLERGVPDLRFAAWLGSSAAAQEAKWLQAMRVVVGGRELGWLDRRFVELVQSVFHWTTGRYVGIRPRREQRVSFPAALLAGALLSSFRRVASAWARHPTLWARRARIQAVTVVVPPHFVDGRRDLCDGCPDAILHEGRLVPSCALAEIERHGRTFEILPGATPVRGE